MMLGREAPSADGPVRSAEGPGVVLLFGDGYCVDRAARQWMAAWCPPDDRVWAAEEVVLESESEDQIVSALRLVLLAVDTAPMWGDRKAVWFRAGAVLASSRFGRGVVEPWLRKLVARIRSGLPRGHHLLITGSDIDRRSALYRAVHECGEVGDFTLPSKPWEQHREMRRLLEQELAAAGIVMEPDAFDVFLDRLGTDGYLMHSEVEKLVLYLGNRRTASAADVREIASITREVQGWDLADCIGMRSVNATISMVRRLLDQRTDPLQIIGGIENRLRDLTILRCALDRQWLRRTDRSVVWSESAEMAATMSALGEWDPRGMHPYRLARLVDQAVNFTAAELVRAGELVTRARGRMVGGFPAPELLLELLVLQIARPSRRSK